MANRTLLEKEIKEYCQINNINDVAGFITQCMLRGFNIFKYGTSPGDNIKRQNGDIIDNGSNREQKPKEKEKKKEVETVKPVVNTPEKKEEKIETQPEKVVITKKRKITVTNID